MITKTKKYIVYVTILVMGLVFGIGLTYIKANYTDQTSSVPSNNVVSPILTVDMYQGGGPEPSFIKLGKLGIGTSGSNVDTSQFTNNTIVVGGQTSTTEGLGTFGDVIIKAQIPSTSNLKGAFIFGDPTDTNLWQIDTNSHPRFMEIEGSVKAAHIVIGSSTADPTSYNLYITPGKGKISNLGSPQYCTLTANDLKNKGCPFDFQYDSTKKIPTYLAKVIPGTGTEIVAQCNMLILQGYAVPDDSDRGKCY